MRQPSVRTAASVAVIVVVALAAAPAVWQASAQGLVEYGSTTGSVGLGGAGAAGGVGKSLGGAMGRVSGAMEGVAGAAGGGSSGGATRLSASASGGGVEAASATTEAALGTYDAGAGQPPEAVYQVDQATEALMASEASALEAETRRRQAKAERNALINSSYGTADFVPSRQRSLDRVIQQAKDMQYSQKTIDNIARALKLQDYDDVEYDVRFGLDDRKAYEQRLKRRREAAARALKAGRDPNTVKIDVDTRFDGGEGGTSQDIYGDAGKGTRMKPGAVGPFVPGMGPGGELGEIDRRFGKLGESAQELPPDVVASIESAVHNAVLDKLRAKGHSVAALNVFLQTVREVKVIVIITTSELPRSAIRLTLRQIRDVIENDVLRAKFPSLTLAQLSSFTLLNEVDNHFYEHPVLYWQLQMPEFKITTREVVPGTPGPGERTPQAKPGPEADQLLNDFLGKTSGGLDN